MIDLINFQQQGLHDVVSNHLKPRVSKMMHHILLPPREKIIHNNHTIPSRHQPVHQMTPHKPRATCHHNPQPLVLQPQRYLPAGIHEFIGKEVATGGEGGGEVGGGGTRVCGGGGTMVGREEGEEEGAYDNADESEGEALLTEDVTEGT